jgi:hypothetical protein
MIYPRTDSNIIPSMGTDVFTKKEDTLKKCAFMYLRTDSNRRFRLRRPTLYPLSYGGNCEGDFTIKSYKSKWSRVYKSRDLRDL